MATLFFHNTFYMREAATATTGNPPQRLTDWFYAACLQNPARSLEGVIGEEGFPLQFVENINKALFAKTVALTELDRHGGLFDRCEFVFGKLLAGKFGDSFLDLLNAEV